MFISKSKARCIVDALCLIVAGRDGCAANEEHQRRRGWHICFAHGLAHGHGPPHGRYVWFAMPAIFGATATDHG